MGDDDSVRTDDPNYIGVDPIYQNAAEDIQVPAEMTNEIPDVEGETEEETEARQAEADAKVEVVERVKENEEKLAEGVNWQGTAYPAEHPDEQVLPGEQHAAAQSLLREAEVTQAQKTLDESQQPEATPAKRSAAKAPTAPKEPSGE